MTARPGTPQAVFTSGELSGNLHERYDLKYYFTGAKLARNVEIIAQGGFRQAPGTRQKSKLARALASVSRAGITKTAPNGGSTANVTDDDPNTALVTSALSGAGPHVLVTVTFPTAKTISAVDVLKFFSGTTGYIAAEYHNGTSWVKIAGRKELSVNARNRRFARPPQSQITATQFRIVAENLAGTGTVTIGDVRFWAETTNYSVMRLRPFIASDGMVYDTVWQGQDVAVFGTTGWLDNIYYPLDGDLGELKTTQKFDTLLAFQKDTPPHRIMRQGGDKEWNWDAVPFANLPNYDYGSVYNNGVAAKWILEFVGFDDDPEDIAFTLLASGEETEGIRGSATLPAVDWVSLAAAIKTALEATAVVGSGINVNVVDDGQISVLFTGAGNDGPVWNMSVTATGLRTVNVRELYTAGSGEPAQFILDFPGFNAFDPTGIAIDITVTKSGTPNTTGDIAVPVSGLAGDIWAILADRIKTALENLSGVATGLTVAKVEDGKISVEFTGTGNEGDEWALAGSVKNKGDAAVVAYKDTSGVTPGETIISTARGWPRCGRFMQQRLLIGGFNGLPSAWMASVLGDEFNFDTKISAANGAMLVPMDTQNEAIQDIVSTRSPLILTDKAEYWLADRTISKSTAPNHVEASRNGVAVGIPVEASEGAAIFVHPQRGVVSEFRYNDVDQNFITEPITLLAAHLVTGVRDQATQRPSERNTAAQHALVLDDGDMRVFAMLRAQDVTAGTRRETDGDFQCCHVDGDNVLVAAVERQVGGVATRFLEKFEPDLLFDQAVSVTLSPASSIVTGMADHEGAVVWAIADNDVLGPFTVSGGQIDLGQVATNVTYGRWIAPRVETLPLPTTVAPRTVIERRRRIHSVHISLEDTTSLAIGANGGRIYNVPLTQFGGPADVRSLNNKFTGTLKVQGLTGYAAKPTVVITQLFPGTLNVRGIVAEAA